jgi:hypothetical protein
VHGIYVTRDYNKTMWLVLTVHHDVYLEACTATKVKRIFLGSVSFIRVMIRNLMTNRELAAEMLVYLNHLTRLSAREKCVEISHETLTSDIMPTNHFHSLQVCMLYNFQITFSLNQREKPSSRYQINPAKILGDSNIWKTIF